jgi:pimeloyl-ACP methyl ester carboxylesterase
MNLNIMAATAALLLSLAAGQGARAQTDAPKAVTNVVLVHGAWADGSSWQKVIPLLEARGLHVVSTQIPLTSFEADVDATRRAISGMDGPVLLVGHSYGGIVITEAGNDAKVAGLVYVAAFAPDDGQVINDLNKGFPPAPGGAEIRPQGGGFLVLTKKGVEEDFGQDLKPAEKALLLATQTPTAGTVFGAKPTIAAWHAKPSWYIVAANDRTIAPDAERAMAKHMGADVTELASSHVAMLARPKEVADVIIDAAAGKTAR